MRYEGYNGWTNKATWLVNLWMGDYFESCKDDGIEVTADFIEASIEDMLADEMNSQSSMLADFVNMCLAEVNWRELAAHYQPEEEYNDSMDGDHASALASAGWGTEEDYYGDNAQDHEF